jgi:hypothetical protein
LGHAIQPADIRKVYRHILPGLVDIIEKTNAEWWPEDIYADCKHGKAFLYTQVDDPQNFVVLELHECPYRGHKILWVLAAYSVENDAFEWCRHEVERLGAEAGCDYISFASPRKGWEKLATFAGYEAGITHYKKALNR